MRNAIPINQPILDDEEIQLVVKVLKSGILTEKGGGGFYVSQFEQEFAKFIGTKYAVAFSSGTAALHATLMTIGLRSDDEVLIPSFSFVAVAEAVVLAGGKPVFVDINPDTYCMDLESLEEQISSRTQAIIPTHLYGLACDMDPIIELAHKHDLIVIEDAAQAHGAEYKGRKAGALGDMACFSFYATKNITTGEGGMITTNNSEYAETLREIRNHGEQKEYKSVIVGHNYRMSEICGAIGVAQISKLPRFLEARRKNAETLTSKLSGVGKLKLPAVPEGYKHSWYVYTVRLRGANAGKRNKVVEKLREKKIGAAVYYPVPIHLMPYYREQFPPEKGVLIKTETAARQVFSLPVHPKIEEEQIEYMADVLKKLLK